MNYDLSFKPYIPNDYWINILNQYVELYANSTFKFERKFEPFSKLMIKFLDEYYDTKKKNWSFILKKFMNIELSLKKDWNGENSLILNSKIGSDNYNENYISIEILFKIAFPEEKVSNYKNLPIQLEVKPSNEYIFQLLFIYPSIYILDKSILLDVYIQTVKDKFNNFDVPNFWKNTFDLDFKSNNNLGFDLTFDWNKICKIFDKLIEYELFEIGKFKFMFEIFFENLKKKKIDFENFGSSKILEVLIYNHIFENIPIITEKNLQSEMKKVRQLACTKITNHKELIKKKIEYNRLIRTEEIWKDEKEEEKIKTCSEFVKNLAIISVYNEILNDDYIAITTRQPNFLYKHSYIFASKDLSSVYYFDKEKGVKEDINLIEKDPYFKCFAIFMLHLGLKFEEYKKLLKFLQRGNYINFFFPSFIDFMKQFKVLEE